MWKTGWKLLLILLLAAVLVSFRGRDAAAKKGAELIQNSGQQQGAYSVGYVPFLDIRTAL